MARFKKIPQTERVGKIVYGSGIVEEIVSVAVSELEYVEFASADNEKKIKTNDIKAVFDKDGVAVDVAVKIHYTQRVPDIAFKIQEAVRHSVESMTEYHLTAVNVYVNGILFEEKPVQLTIQEN